GDATGRRARPQGRPPDPTRSSDLPVHGPLDVRPVARRVSHQGRSRRAAQTRPDLATCRQAQGGGRAGRGGAGRPRCRGTRGDRGCGALRRSEPRSRSRRAHDPRVGRLMATLTYRDALNQALREEMQRDPNVFLMGEEVGVYQGAYKVSRGLLEEFGPKRIVDTPIAELGFAGVGVGAAMAGLNPVIELEGEMLYNLKGEVPDGEHIVPIGRAEVKRPGSDVTLICHSKTVAVALKAAEQLAEHEGASAEVLDLRSLRPLDEAAILESVARTNR